ncbi:MAG: amino acid adenylation domain-containing protein, partial [Longimicrobiaceae bacterium]
MLCFTLHHVVGDGWSTEIMVRELSALYGAFGRGDPSPLPELPVQYADFAVWQREWLGGEVLEAQLAFWREQLRGAPPLLEIPTDRPRSAGQGAQAGRHDFALSAAATAGLRALSRCEGATLFMTLLAGWQALLGRWAGQDDVVVGSTIAGRTRRETEGLIGFFVNMLALRADLSGDPSWTELLGRVRERTVGAYDHQELPFERLVDELGVERSLAHSPVFQATFALNRAGAGDGAPRLGDLALEAFGGGAHASKFDLELVFGEAGDGLEGALVYRAALFEAATVARLCGHLEATLGAMADGPRRPVSAVALLRGAERAQVLEAWNATRADYPAATLHALVSAQAARTPDAVAVAFEGESLTYAALEARADALAARLRRLGVGPETRVGVCAERSVELVVALLAVLKAGGAYVPLDPSYPANRLAYMLVDSGVRVLLAQERLAALLPSVDAAVLVLDGSEEYEVRSTLHTAQSEDGVPSLSHSQSLAYVIYTSGSTGRPKGAMNAHRGIVNRLLWMQEEYGLGADDVVLQKTPFSFDVSVWEFFWPLISGAKLVLAKPDGHRDPAYLSELIEREGVTTLHFVPPMLHAFLDAGEPGRCGSLRRVMCSGEALPYELTERFRAALPGAGLHNLYGPTEAAVDVTYWACEPRERRVVPIGRPVANTRLYVLDGAGEPVPVGVPGELLLGGVQVGRGYLGRPELTAEKFVPDPFSAEAGARLYRTGDRARWTPAGEVEYLGRLDHQVKIRGFRIEPGEIEAALLEHPAVGEAVVLVREDAPNDRRLAAYVAAAAGAEVTGEALREHLRRSLPGHMVPAAFVALESLPLTPNGKVDRRMLPAPEAMEDEGYVGPRTVAEELLAGIWAEVLHLDRVGAEESFFELGGYSLLATQVVSRARQAFGVEVPLRALFEALTVAGLAARIEALRSAGTSLAPPMQRVSREEPLPVSFAQQRLWVVDRLEPDSPAYNMPYALRLRGALDTGALQTSLDALVARHETLRTTFAEHQGGPVQVVHPPAPVALRELDLRDLPAAEREAGAERLETEEALLPFDLARGPLLRTTLLRLADDEHVLCFTLHHIVTDGWSRGVLVREASALYAAALRGEAAQLPELEIQYADFAVWQRRWLSGETLEEQLGYWRERLAGAPPLLEVPVDRPRSLGLGARAGTHNFSLPARLSSELRALSRREGTTLFMTVLSGWQALLGRYAGQDDVVVGSPIAGRNRRETEGLIGFFVNMLALRADLGGDPTWAELLGRVREEALGAFEHQDLPFERLVEELVTERSRTHSPLFQVVFALNRSSGREELSLDKVKLEPFGEGGGVARFDLNLAVMDEEEALAASLTYREGLFEAETAARMAAHFEALLEAMAAAPGQRLSEVSLLRGAEREQLLHAWNGPDTGYAGELCIHELVHAQVLRTLHAPALRFEQHSLIYDQLFRRSCQLAHRLRREGVGPEVLVAICMEAAPEAVVSVLGVLLAGGAYLPLDPALPPERRAYMLGDARPVLLLTQSALAERLEDCGVPLLRVDADAGRIAQESEEPPVTGVCSDNLAYVIYTSGSTGRPKGVLADHRGVGNTFLELGRVYGSGVGERNLAYAPLHFDAAVADIFTALCNGAELVLARREDRLPGEDLARLLREQAITHLKIMPSALAVTPAEELPALKAVITGGEVLPVEQVRRWGVGRKFFNGYGATEAGIRMTSSAYTADAGDPPIGRPVANTQLYVLDAQLEPVPPGVAGELYIGGAGMARGYLGRPDLTAERFLPDPHGRVAGARLYRAGDVGRRRADGEIEFLGRTDHQVKVRGYRVELGEIEAVLRMHAQVKEAVVLLREDVPGQPRLVAYVTGKEGAELSVAELRAHAGEQLPEYMVPWAIVVLERLPVTINGKIDRRALPAPERPRDAEHVAPRTPAEEVLAGIWAEVLGTERVGLEESFFELGGDSILSIQVVSRARQRGLKLTPRQLFEHPTVARLAQVAEWTVSEVTGVEQGPVRGEAPLTPAQQRFFEHDFAARHHFNQALLLRPREALHAGRLARAAAALEAHHDALRLRFHQESAGTWRQWHAGAGERASLTVFDLSRLPEQAQRRALEASAEQVQRSLELERGPLVRIGWFELGAERSGRLLWVVHHLAVDGVSWRILLEDLESAYAQISRGEAVRLPAKTTSWQAWARRLVEHAASEGLAQEAGYWARQAQEAVATLPVDDPAGENTVAASRSVAVRLSEEETEGLLRDVPAAYRTQIDEVLLCALAGALRRWTGERRMRIDLEAHGREELFADVDLSRTAGWFTSVYPVVLELPRSGGKGEALKAVKEQLRAVSQRGIGYGLLRYLGASGSRADLARGGQAEVGFNYLGQFDQAVSGEAFFSFAQESAGASLDGRSPRRYLLDVVGSVRGGCLEIVIGYGSAVHRAETVERLAEWYAEELRTLVAHCRSAEAGGYTPSDFPLSGLEQAELDALLGSERGVEDVYPLSPMQEGVLFHVLYAPESGVYVGQFGFVLDGPLDVDSLERAWQGVVARHEALRAAFAWEGVPRPMQVVRGEAKLPFRVEDWRGLEGAEQQARLERYLEEDRAAGLELKQAPLMRLALFRVGGEEHRLVWTHHHLILDGWSLSLIFSDVLEHYAAYVGGAAPQLPPGRRYREYAGWLARQDRGGAERFWKRVLAGFGAPTPLPAVRARKGAAEGHGAATSLLSAEQTQALQEQARRWAVTLSTLVQGAWALLLSRYAGEDDVVFGATVSGRPAELAGVEETVGLFINTLPVRAQLRSDARLGEWLSALQREQVEAREYEYTPLVEVQRWSEVPAGEELFGSLVVYENYPVDQALGEKADRLRGLRVRTSFGRQQTNYPLVLVAETHARLKVELRYERAVVDDEAARRLLAHLEVVLEEMAAHPERRLSAVPMLRDAERAQLLKASIAPVPEHARACVHELFSTQVARTPLAPAVSFGDETLTYAELERAANRLAHHLRARGVGPESRVAVCAERSAELVVALLGVLKAGGAYVPIDPSYPAERIAYLVEDSGCAAVLVQDRLRPLLGETRMEVHVLEDALAETGGAEAAPRVEVDPQNAAYVIYTSGSTGRPKGVVVTHGNVSRLFAATQAWFDFDGSDVWTLFHSYAFDFSVWEMWGALLHGGRLVVVPWQTSRDPEAFYALLVRERVTVLNQTPSAFRQLAAEEARGASAELALRVVVFGGEALDPGSLRGWMERHGGEVPRLVNMYGITETTVHVTYRPLGRADVEAGEGSPVGEAIPDLGVRVLDRWGSPVPVGVPGELYVGGAGVARGYLGRPELTAERFVPDAFGGEAGSGARLYRSGDRARWLAAGELEYLGRADAQVKVRGFRIEPGEIEAALVALPQVREAVVTVREDAPGQKRLVAYVVGEAGAEVVAAELREELSSRLPEHMVPAAFVVLGSVPLTANGKVDRRALPAPETAAAGEGFVAPRTEVEEILGGIWAEVLGVERVGVEDGFFELGGDSILSIQVVSRARQQGLKLTPRQLFERPTIARLAEVVERTGAAATAQEPVTGEAPLTPIQHRFFERPSPAQHHFNQALLLVPRQPLRAALLARAAGALEAHHDALRLRFRQEASGAWRQSHAGVGGRAPLTVFDLSRLPEAERRSAMEAAAERVQRSLDLGRGPLLRMAYFDPGGGLPGRLLVVIHHLAIDGVSWRILLEDLESAYAQLSRGEAVRLPAKTTSWKAWAERLAEHARSEALAREAGYWAGQARQESSALPVDDPGADGSASHPGSVSVRLSEEETGALLREVPQAYRTRIDEVLLTALAAALGRWTGERRVRIDLEGHGREEEAVGGAELSRTVGWFTTVYPVVLDLPETRGAGAALKAVKEQLRAVPHHGIGYGLLRYLAGGETGAEPAGAAELRRAVEPEVAFNYLGQFDQSVSGESFFAFAEESPGASADERTPRRHLLEVSGSVRGGRLELKIDYEEGVHRRETVERLAESYGEELREIIAHCTSDRAGGYTPSDFPL